MAQKSLFEKPVQRKRYEAIKKRAFTAATIEDASYQHSIFCQTSLPYRKVEGQYFWKKEQGRVSLSIQCLKKTHPKTRESIYLGLPYGTKARLILAYIDTEAIKKQTTMVDVGDSMTQFIKRIGLATKGRNYSSVKDQLARIAASVISLEYITDDERSLNTQFSFVKNYDLWFPKDDNKRVLWPTVIELSTDYAESLMEHAIPLDENALAALSNNAMALDIYRWLAQRLHRVDPSKPQFIPWASLKDQFGDGYGRMSDFKGVFRKTMEMVTFQYRDAKIEEDKNKGFILKHSQSPIPKKVHLINPK